MTGAWNAILAHVARKIGEAAEAVVEPSELVAPPDAKLGDLAYGCFKIAKALKRPPADVAKDIADKMKKPDSSIESVGSAGPYLNVTLKAGQLIDRIVGEVEARKGTYGSSDEGKGKMLMLEYAQPNTHKEIHIGHLRNLVLGASIVHLLTRAGWKTVAASYHGDVGAHVAKCLWLLIRMNAEHVPQPAGKTSKKKTAPPSMSADAWTDHVLSNLDATMARQIIDAIPASQRTGKHLGELYAESTKLLEENPDWKSQVSDVQLKLEAHDKAWEVIWQETRRWSVDEFGAVFDDLGVRIDRQYFESEVVDEGQKIVDRLLAKGIAKMSQGATVVDLEAEKLGVFLIRKTDGTSLYATKDLSLAWKKLKEYPDLERSLLLVDNRQSLYFKQLFRTLELMEYPKPHEFIGYEVVTLKSGAMSSREGNIVTYQSFRDEVVGFARKETIARHADWNEGKVEHTAWCLAMGGVKYGMLKQDADKMYTFDLERALSFDGDTGPYIQYATTRLSSILKKANWDPKKGLKQGDLLALSEPSERQVALQMARFPEACLRAANELKPSVIAQWCFGMAQRVNDFYRDVPVLESAEPQRAGRLRLVAAAASTLILGLDLLGIPLPEEM